MYFLSYAHSYNLYCVFLINKNILQESIPHMTRECSRYRPFCATYDLPTKYNLQLTIVCCRVPVANR